MATAEAPPKESPPAVRPRQFLAVILIAGVVGIVVSLAAWGFLQLTHYLQVWLYDDLPEVFGYDHGAPPEWWPLPLCAIAGLITAIAILRLPGRGGHVPAHGLNAGATDPIELPGVLLAAFATLGLGIVLGPEAPLIALGGGLGIFTIRLARRDAPDDLVTLMAGSGAFAAISFIFDSPLIAAMILIEATGLGGPRLPMLLVPGLFASAVGSLLSIGLGDWTGLNTSNYALSALDLPAFARPDVVDFGWTIALAAAIGFGAFAIMFNARRLLPLLESRELVLLPLAGLAIAGLAIGFQETADKPFQNVLFSGEDALPSLVEGSETWAVSALALLLAFKSAAWSISLAGFRGGPVFPSLFLGAAAGLMASHLPGFDITPAVAVGMAAGTAATLGLPLSAIVMATVLTGGSGAGATPLIIVAAIIGYLIRRAMDIEAREAPAPA